MQKPSIALPKPRDLSAPLSEREFIALGAALERTAALELDGLLGLLHAVAVAPSMIPPSEWLQHLLRDEDPRAQSMRFPLPPRALIG